MGTIRTIIFGCALMVLPVTAASAADLGLPPPPPQFDMPPPPPTCCVTPWYLRGYMGQTSYDLDKMTAPDIGDNFQILHTTFEASGFWGIGVGYQWSDKFRFDATTEYRNRATFHGLDRFSDNGAFVGTNEYTATYKAWVTQFNAYWDIYKWNLGCCGSSITPYVGGGIGFAKYWLGNFTDVNTPVNSVFFAGTNSGVNFAWNLQAGVAFDVTQNFTIDLGYRYLNLGDAKSGKFHAYGGSGTGAPITFEDMHSHDLMLGARWRFGSSGPKPMPISWK